MRETFSVSPIVDIVTVLKLPRLLAGMQVAGYLQVCKLPQIRLLFVETQKGTTLYLYF
jgi:hypothetical protein